MVQASLMMIVIYDHPIFIIQAIGLGKNEMQPWRH
jgi:hypothetical protein